MPKTPGWPELDLPLIPPYPPMEAQRKEKIPQGGGGWQYEPKWDGFRALVFRDRDEVAIQSKAGQPLHRYFPEIVEAVLALPAKRFVLDGELAIPIGGRLSFDDLLQRIHPAASRIEKLAQQTPGQLLVFDLLAEPYGRGRVRSIAERPLEERRERLEEFFAALPPSIPFHLTPATTDFDIASEWFRKWASAGLDGVMAKRLGIPYRSGERDGMVKVKRFREADCVVGGFRYSSGGKKSIGAILLGLYDSEGRLVFTGHSSTFTAAERKELVSVLEPLKGSNHFEVRVPGGPSRWASERSSEWVPLEPKLVCEVRYDAFTQGRFRHGTKFVRWRPDKSPRSCTIDQVTAESSPALRTLLRA
jgi:ATP-dependent DNA ligase